MKFAVFQLTRKGGRDKNEDRMGYCYAGDTGLFMLADGMGGHPEGEVAAQLALESMAGSYQQCGSTPIVDAGAFLNSALLRAHTGIQNYAREKVMPDAPRTTLVAALLLREQLSWVHCGDSRLYLVRRGELITRTRDHSYNEQRAGAPGSAAARASRHVLYTCLGAPQRPEFDVAGPVAMQAGDRVLLCSDGLWDNVDEADILALLGTLPVHEAVPDLVELALSRGGVHCDNVTALAIEWEPADAAGTLTDLDTQAMDRDSFATTFTTHLSTDACGRLLADVEPLDDAAIERAIHEINDAIRRTTAAKP